MEFHMKRPFAMKLAGKMHDGISEAEKAYMTTGGRIYLRPLRIVRSFWPQSSYESDEHTMTVCNNVTLAEASALGRQFAIEALTFSEEILKYRYNAFDTWINTLRSSCSDDEINEAERTRSYTARVYLETSVNLVSSLGVISPYMSAMTDYFGDILQSTGERQDALYDVQLRRSIMTINGYCNVGDETFDDYEERLKAERIEA